MYQRGLGALPTWSDIFSGVWGSPVPPPPPPAVPTPIAIGQVIGIDPNAANIQLTNTPPFQPSGNPNAPLMSPIPGMTQADYDAIQADLGLLPGPAAGPSAFDTSGGFVGALSAPGSLPAAGVPTWVWVAGAGVVALLFMKGGRR